MLRDIKNIEIKRIQDAIDEYQRIENELSVLKENITKTEKDVEIIKDLEEKIKNYSFIKRIIDRKSYKKDLDNLNKLKAISVSEKLEEITKKKEELENKIELLPYRQLYREKQTTSYLEILDNVLKSVNKAITINQLGYTFEKAVEVLKENNIPIILDISDIESYNAKRINTNSQLDKKEDYILVRKTQYKPKNDKIISSKEANGVVTFNIDIDGNIIPFTYKEPRDTIHFCLNGEVTSHAQGNFEDRKYAILLPFNIVPDDNLCVVEGEDTFYKSNVPTENGYVICPENEVEEMQKNNPKTIVIGYKGESVDGYANTLLTYLGYQPVEVHPTYWGKEEQQVKLSQLAKEKGYRRCPHGDSLEKTEENKKRSLEFIKGYINMELDYMETYGIENIDDFIQKSIIKVMQEKNLPSFTRAALSNHFDIANGKTEDLYLDEKNKNNGLDADTTNIISIQSMLYLNYFNISINQSIIDLIVYYKNDLNKSSNSPEYQEIINRINDDNTKKLIETYKNKKSKIEVKDVLDLLVLEDIAKKVYSRAQINTEEISIKR